MRTALIVAFVLLVLAGSAQAQTLNVRLRINNVENSVYVPGPGEMQAGSLGPGTTYVPEHFYIASYLDNIMYALAGASGAGVYAATDGGAHVVGVDQELQGSKILLGFTRGDWHNVDSVTKAMESGSFFQEIAPSFSFGVGALYPVKVLLAYSGINITGDLRLHSGFRKLTISNEGFRDGQPTVRIESS